MLRLKKTSIVALQNANSSANKISRLCLVFTLTSNKRFLLEVI